MDGFLGKMIEKFAEKATGGSSNSGGDGYSSYNQQQPSYGGQGQGYNSGPAPPQDLPYPWVPRWDDRDQRWFYVNEQTGERSWERPYGGSGGPSYGERSYGQPQPSYGYEGGYLQAQEQRPEHKDHSMMYGAAAGAAGLVGGAILMHEGEKIRELFLIKPKQWRRIIDSGQMRTGMKRRRESSRMLRISLRMPHDGQAKRFVQALLPWLRMICCADADEDGVYI